MRWTWLIEQIESLLRWFFEKFLSIAGGHLFNPFSKMLLWSVLLLQDAAESARKAEQSRKRAEDIAAGTVQMNGRELFLHEPWVFDDSRVWGFFSLAQTAFHSLMHAFYWRGLHLWYIIIFLEIYTFGNMRFMPLAKKLCWKELSLLMKLGELWSVGMWQFIIYLTKNFFSDISIIYLAVLNLPFSTFTCMLFD